MKTRQSQAIPYQRFSATTQSKGSSLERQQDLIDEWFRTNPKYIKSNLNPIDRGRSAYKGEHLKHGFGLILSAIESKDIISGDVILVEAIDRVGRLPPMEMLTLFQTILANGVDIITLEDQATYSAESLNNNMSSLYILVGKVQQAHEYSKRLSSRIKASYESKRRKARAGEDIRITNPFWLNKDGTLNEKKANIVKKCITAYIRGLGSKRILTELSDEHPELLTVHPTTLKRWFVNRALIGEWDNMGDYISDVFEPLIDYKTFMVLQKCVSKRYKTMSKPETYKISGILVCEKCQKRYRIRRKKYKNRVILYTNCSTYLKRGKLHCDNNTTFPYEVVNVLYNETFEDHISEKLMSEVPDTLDSDIEVLKYKEKDINERIDRLLKVVEVSSEQSNAIDRIKELEEIKQSLKSEIRQKTSIESSDKTDLYYELLNKKIEDLDSDNTLLTNFLINSGYKIYANGKTLYTKTGPSKFQRLTIYKRHIKHNCYLVEFYEPAYEILDQDDDLVLIPETSVKMCVNFKGIIFSSTQFNDWEEFLEAYEKNGSTLLEY